jgi:Heterokaryon incompatibility protein (HET)
MPRSAPKSTSGGSSTSRRHGGGPYASQDAHTDTSSANPRKRKTWSLPDGPVPTAEKRRRPGNVKIDPTPADISKEKSKDKWLRAAKEKSQQYDYELCPLKEREIRLLVLKPSEDPVADIIIELKSFDLKELEQNKTLMPYAALSYHWGDGMENNPILVDVEGGEDGKEEATKLSDVVRSLMNLRRLNVKPNLYKALRELRDKEKETHMWVDAICINQGNNKEKEGQVSKMSKIYSTARRVIIWLGHSDEKTDSGMNFINVILKEHDIEEKISAKYVLFWSHLLYLMRSSWFSRRWIIQELALAKDAEVRCGKKRVHWRDFSDAISLFALNFDRILLLFEDKENKISLARDLASIRDMAPLGARILVDILGNTFLKHADGTLYEPRQGLESLVSLLSRFDTSDPRDTIYALLNIAKESCNMGSSPRQSRLQSPPPLPDYTLTLFQVYLNFVRWVVNETGSLDILCRHWALPERKEPSEFYPTLTKLPSWIKTVRDSPYGSQQEGFGGRKNGDSFVGLPDRRCYNACHNTRAEIAYGFGEAYDGLVPSEPRFTDHFRETPPRHMNRDADNEGPNQQQGPPSPPSRGSQDWLTSIVVTGVKLDTVAWRTDITEGVIPGKALKHLGYDAERDEVSSVSDRVWRTLVADRGPDGRNPPAWYHRACLKCLVQDTPGGNIETNQLLGSDDTPQITKDYLKRVQAACWNRAYIEAGKAGKQTLVGLGPSATEINDIIVILFGCSVPVVLRPVHIGRSTGEKPDHYKFIGETFILGMMDGEAIAALTPAELEQKTESFRLL